MISFIKGTILSNERTSVVIETSSGVGYEVFVTEKLGESLRVGREVALHIYLSVRENAMDLFGFGNLEEKELFLKFLLVSGIGPRTALHLLSMGSVEEISGAISRGDVVYLTNVAGVGKKTAERIVVELKSKVLSLKSKVTTGEGRVQDGGALTDVVDGLVAMGYSQDEARAVVRELDADGKKAEELLKEALRRMR